MINPFHEINWRPGLADLRTFARSLMLGFPCLALAFFLLKALQLHAWPEVGFFLKLGGVGCATGAVCWLLPTVARPLYYAWYALAACMGLVMANLLFALLFYGLFTPLGWGMRLFGRDPLHLRFRRGQTSYWTEADPAPPVAQYFRQY